jgi:hypothetical protein
MRLNIAMQDVGAPSLNGGCESSSMFARQQGEPKSARDLLIGDRSGPMSLPSTRSIHAEL